MPSLSSTLTEIMQDAFTAHNLPSQHGIVRVSDRPDLAQFQCNGAMPCAKIAKANPREIAGKIVEWLENNHGDMFTKLEIAGPGFINIDLTDAYIRDYLDSNGQNQTIGFTKKTTKDTVILDYGGPNVAKAMHVGHLRSSIIGEALRRMYVFAGYTAISDVHIGDWGLPMGQILSELEIMHPEWPYFNPDHADSYPNESPVTLEQLAEIYPKASRACKEDEARLEIARNVTAKLQDGHPGYRSLWTHCIEISKHAMKANFDTLCIYFDWWLGESDAHDYIAPMIAEYKDKALAVEDDGALIVPIEKTDTSKEIPPLILLKKDGAVMYGTTDLATIKQRAETDHLIRIVYIVDNRQSLHFEQVFHAARLGDIAPPECELIHAGFGTMNGPDGKPFKTRAGGVMPLDTLIQMTIDKASVRVSENTNAKDWSKDEKEDVARKIAIAALKFADLQNNRVADYIFDIDRMTEFEGKTGPYILYQIVRMNSLLEKADQNSVDFDTIILEEKSRPLWLLLAEFNDHFNASLAQHAPHILCDYAYKLAQGFSSFYGSTTILKEEDTALRDSRLALCISLKTHLETIMDLLGIDIAERM